MIQKDNLLIKQNDKDNKLGEVNFLAVNLAVLLSSFLNYRSVVKFKNVFQDALHEHCQNFFALFKTSKKSLEIKS